MIRIPPLSEALAFQGPLWFQTSFSPKLNPSETQSSAHPEQTPFSTTFFSTQPTKDLDHRSQEDFNSPEFTASIQRAIHETQGWLDSITPEDKTIQIPRAYLINDLSDALKYGDPRSQAHVILLMERLYTLEDRTPLSLKQTLDREWIAAASQVLRDSNQDLKIRIACLNLIAQTAPRALDALEETLQALSDPLPEIREQAQRTAGALLLEIGKRESLNPTPLQLHKALKKHPLAPTGLVGSFQASHSPQSMNDFLPEILKGLKDPEARVKVACLETLSSLEITNDAILGEILHCLEDTRPSVKVAALQTLRSLYTQHYLEYPLSKTTDLDTVVKIFLHVHAMLGEESPRVLAEAVGCMSDFVDFLTYSPLDFRGYLDSLCENASDEHCESDEQIKQAHLAFSTFQRYTPSLLRALHETSQSDCDALKNAAHDAMGIFNIPAEPQVTEALAQLKKTDESQILASLLLLTEWGPRIPHAFDAVLPLLNHGNPQIRSASYDALGAIDATNAKKILRAKLEDNISEEDRTQLLGLLSNLPKDAAQLNLK